MREILPTLEKKVQEALECLIDPKIRENLDRLEQEMENLRHELSLPTT